MGTLIRNLGLRIIYSLAGSRPGREDATAIDRNQVPRKPLPWFANCERTFASSFFGIARANNSRHLNFSGRAHGESSLRLSENASAKSCSK